MTGALVNERLQKIILTYLYKKRHAGTPVILNDLWRKHNKESTQFRITLQYLLKDKEYIWSQNHRDVGNTYNGQKQTLDNVTVSAKITEKGIEFYRKEYRDQFFKYWGLRLPIIAAVFAALGWTINTFMFNPADKSTTQQQNIINQNPVINPKNSDSAKQTLNFNQATQTNLNNGDVVNGDKIVNNNTVIISNLKPAKPKLRQLAEQNISLIKEKELHSVINDSIDKKVKTLKPRKTIDDKNKSGDTYNVTSNNQINGITAGKVEINVAKEEQADELDIPLNDNFVIKFDKTNLRFDCNPKVGKWEKPYIAVSFEEKESYKKFGSQGSMMHGFAKGIDGVFGTTRLWGSACGFSGDNDKPATSKFSYYAEFNNMPSYIVFGNYGKVLYKYNTSNGSTSLF